MMIIILSGIVLILSAFVSGATSGGISELCLFIAVGAGLVFVSAVHDYYWGKNERN